MLPGLAIGSVDGEGVPPIDDKTVAAALDGADLVIVDNLCSLPLNVEAARSVARVTGEHHGRVLFRHHDLPWQRRHLAHLGDDLPPRVDGALHATINLRSRRELEARGFADAITIHNFFDLDPPPGRSRRRRAREFGFADDDFVMLQPSRAIERKNVPGAHPPRDAPRAHHGQSQRAALDLGPRRRRLRRHVGAPRRAQRRYRSRSAGPRPPPMRTRRATS